LAVCGAEDMGPSVEPVTGRSPALGMQSGIRDTRNLIAARADAHFVIFSLIRAGPGADPTVF